MKTCTQCKKEKPITEFYFRPNYNGTKTKYRLSVCRECAKKRAVAWAVKNRKRFNLYQRNYQKKLRLQLTKNK